VHNTWCHQPTSTEAFRMFCVIAGNLVVISRSWSGCLPTWRICFILYQKIRCLYLMPPNSRVALYVSVFVTIGGSTKPSGSTIVDTKHDRLAAMSKWQNFRYSYLGRSRFVNHRYLELALRLGKNHFDLWKWIGRKIFCRNAWRVAR